MRLAAAAANFGFMFLLVAGTASMAAEIKVLSGNGAKAAISELAAQFERASGHKVVIHFEVNAAVQRNIEAGEPFDVAVLNPPVLDELIKQRRIVADTRAVIGRAGMGAANRAGAPRPDISSVEAFKRTLTGVKSVAYPGEGASGKYFVNLVDRLGLTSAMTQKMRPMPAENTVEVVADGEADLVVVVASRISGVPSVQSLGLIPQDLQTWIGFTAGVGSGAREPEAAREMIRFFTAPAAAPVLKALGVEPFVE